MNAEMRTLVEIVLRDFPSAQAIYLLGSYARGEQHTQSDIDLAVLLPVDIARRRWRLTALALAKQARRDVDLVNLRLVSTVFQNEIIHTGVLLYCSDEPARQEFEMLALSAYIKQSEERADILRAFLRTRQAYDVSR
jgi:predicted nucleotidyltransferase